MNSLTSYISGRTPGGGARGGGGSSQQAVPQQHDLRNNRGGSSMSNGRGGSRGRGDWHAVNQRVCYAFSMQEDVTITSGPVVAATMRKTMVTMLEVVTKPLRHRRRGHGGAIIRAVVELVAVDRLAIVYDPLTIGE